MCRINNNKIMKKWPNKYHHTPQPHTNKADNGLRMALRAKAQKIRKMYFKLHHDNPQRVAMTDKINGLLTSINGRPSKNNQNPLATEQQTITKDQQYTQPLLMPPSFNDMLYRVTKQTKKQARKALRSHSYHCENSNALFNGCNARYHPNRAQISQCQFLSSNAGPTKQVHRSQNNLSKTQQQTQQQTQQHTQQHPHNRTRTQTKANKKGHLFKGLTNIQTHTTLRNQTQRSQVTQYRESNTDTHNQYIDYSEEQSTYEFKPVGMVARCNQLLANNANRVYNRSNSSNPTKKQLNKDIKVDSNNCRQERGVKRQRPSTLSEQSLLKQKKSIFKQQTLQQYCDNGKTLIKPQNASNSDQNTYLSSHKTNNLSKTPCTFTNQMLAKNRNINKSIVADYNAHKMGIPYMYYTNSMNMWNNNIMIPLSHQSQTATIGKQYQCHNRVNML